MEDKHIELRSDAVREIIGRSPSWLVRWGSFTLAGVIVLILVGSAWFHYPDRLISVISIISDEPPVEIVARNDGYLERLLVRDSQQVNSGQVLGILESSVSYDFVKSIHSSLDSLILWSDVDSLSAIHAFVNKSSAQPGQLKDNFSRLLAALRNYLGYHELEKYEGKIAQIRQEQRNTRIHFDRLYEQRQLRGQDLELAEKMLLRQKALFESGTISAAEFERASQDYLGKKLQFEQVRSELSAYQIALDQIDQRILDLRIQNLEEIQMHKTLIQEEIMAIKGAIAEWELNYVFHSPIPGIVSFTSIYSENQRIRKGDKVMTILRQDVLGVRGKLLLPVSGSGKAAAGQKVLVKIDKFPHLEYGLLIGYIESISLAADQDYYTVEVVFPDGLVSTYGTELRLTQGMTGQAEIITENLSFLSRIISPVKYMLTRNKEIR